MTRTRYGILAALLAGMALMLAGCGDDDNGGLSAADMARLDAADAAAAAQQAADAAASELSDAQDELADLQAQLADAEMDTDDEDTSDLDAAITALQMQIAALIDKTADPATPLAILGGEKDTMSANDRAALATKIAVQLNGLYDHDGDKGMANLPEINETVGDGRVVNVDMRTRNITHASGAGIMSADGTCRRRWPPTFAPS